MKINAKQQVLVFDDHALILNGLKGLLSDLMELEIIGVISSYEELKRVVELNQIDIAILDIQMPEKNGFHCAEEVRIKHPSCKIIFISMYHQEDYVKKAIELGCRGYILKSSDPDEIVHGIKEVAKGNHYFSKNLSAELLNNLVSKAKIKSTHNQSLTNREIEVIKKLCAGLSNKEIADQLFVSIRTVEFHRANIFKKLELTNVVDLVKYAIKNKIVDL